MAGEKCFLQMNEFDELRMSTYENARIYKDRTKMWHDGHIKRKDIREGDQVLVFNSRLRLFPGKLKSRWYGPYIVKCAYPHGGFLL